MGQQPSIESKLDLEIQISNMTSKINELQKEIQLNENCGSELQSLASDELIVKNIRELTEMLEHAENERDEIQIKNNIDVNESAEIKHLRIQNNQLSESIPALREMVINEFNALQPEYQQYFKGTDSEILHSLGLITDVDDDLIGGKTKRRTIRKRRRRFKKLTDLPL